MFPKKGKKLHQGSDSRDREREFRQGIAVALKRELGSTHQGIKTIMRWTGASERTVKHWFAGTHAPNGYHLTVLARHSDSVLQFFLLAAERRSLQVGMNWISIRAALLELIELIGSETES
jgi:hypothetical protein